MAKDTNRVLDETIGAFKQLREQVKAYKDELATLSVGTDEWNKKARELANAQKQVDAINKAAKGTLVEYGKAQQNSINALKERIKLLNQERNAMDMNSKEYKEATKELNDLNSKLREAKTSSGDWSANVGNYAQAIKSSFADLGSAANGLSGHIGVLNGQFLKLAASPAGAAVAALVGTIKFLSSGIKSSEENTNKWNEAMVPLKTIIVMIQREAQNAASKFIDWVKSLRESDTAAKIVKTTLEVLITMFEQTKNRINNLIEGLKMVGSGFRTAFEKAKDWVGGVENKFPNLTSKVKEFGDAIKTKIRDKIEELIGLNDRVANSWIGKILGLQTSTQIKEAGERAEEVVENITEEFKETEREVTKVTKASNALAGTLRGLNLRAAELRGDIASLSADYAEALEDSDYERAMDLLDQKTEKELELAEVQKNIAAAQLNVIKQTNALAGSSTEALNEENAALVSLKEAEASEDAVRKEAARTRTKLQKQIDSANEKEKADALRESIAALTQELNKYTQAYQTYVADMTIPERPEGSDITRDSLNAYYDQLNANAAAEYNAYADMQDAKIAKLQEFIDIEKEKGNEVLAQETELAKLREEQASGYPQQYKKMIVAVMKSDKDRAKQLTALQRSEIQGYANLFDSVSGLFEQNTFAYKATATAKALINTYLAATSALAETPGGAIAKGVAMAATLAAGMAQVMAIWKTNPKGETSVPTTSSNAVAEPVVVESQPFTYSRNVQTFEEEDRLNQPIFVSVTDINNVQNRVQVVEQESSF